MDSEKSSLNPSSLLDLKAEVHKKYESFQRAKLSQKSDSPKSTTFKYKGQPIPKEKKNLPKVILKSKENSEEELALKKSRLALEAKAKLYEKITSNNILIDDEDNEKYLVDFHRKVLYSTHLPDKTENNRSNFASPENDSVSYVSSQILKKESYNEKLTTINNQNNKTVEENSADQPVHYQNVQFNEVRDHGTGYFAFSMEESKRKEQMEELNKLRQETEEQRVASQRIQRKRKAMLEARLAKICERRNIDKSVVQAYTSTEENSDDANPAQSVDLSSIPLPETPEVPEKKEIKIRPWDIGKSTFTPFVPEQRKTKSQSDWIEEKRSERPSEFAPPSFYR